MREFKSLKSSRLNPSTDWKITTQLGTADSAVFQATVRDSYIQRKSPFHRRQRTLNHNCQRLLQRKTWDRTSPNVQGRSNHHLSCCWNRMFFQYLQNKPVYNSDTNFPKTNKQEDDFCSPRFPRWLPFTQWVVFPMSRLPVRIHYPATNPTS